MSEPEQKHIKFKTAYGNIIKLVDSETFKKKFRWTFNLQEKVGEIFINHPSFFIKFESFSSTELEGVPGAITSTDNEFPIAFHNEAFKFISWNLDDAKESFWKYINQFLSLKPNATFEEKEALCNNWKGQLTMYDGCGTLMETWTAHGIIPWKTKFESIDSDEHHMEVLLIYKRIGYQSHRPTEPNNS